MLKGNFWLVLVDSILVAPGYWLSYLLRFGFEIPREYLAVFEVTVLGVAGFHLHVWGYVSLAGTHYVLGVVAGFRGAWTTASGRSVSDRPGGCDVEGRP